MSTLPRKYRACLPEVSPKPPLPPCSPPLPLICPAKLVSPSDHTMARPASPATRASTDNSTPAATRVSTALTTSGFLPWKSPPTRMAPPPASPDAFTVAPASRATERPSNSIRPPVACGVSSTRLPGSLPASRLLDWALSNPAARACSAPKTRMLPAGAPSTTTVDCTARLTLPCSALRLTLPPAAAAPATPSAPGFEAAPPVADNVAMLPSDTSPDAELMPMVPPDRPAAPSERIWAPADNSTSLTARNTTLPPSSVAVRAWIRPLWRSDPANMPTAPPCKVPRLMALLSGFWTSKRRPSRPRPVISTDCPAPRITLPLAERTNPSLPTPTFGASKTTSPSLDRIMPSTWTPPFNPLPWKRNLPAAQSASLTCSADAVKPAVSTTAPLPTVMPDWLISTTRPLEPSSPNISDGVLVTTRFNTVLDELTC